MLTENSAAHTRVCYRHNEERLKTEPWKDAILLFGVTTPTNDDRAEHSHPAYTYCEHTMCVPLSGLSSQESTADDQAYPRR